MPRLHVVTRMTAHPDDVEAMKEILQSMVEPTRAEPGCRRYDLVQSCEDPATFMFLGEWDSDEALEAHRQTEHIMGGFGKMAPMIEGEMEFQYYRETDLGGE